MEFKEANSGRTDVQAIRENYITVTPLQFNLTCASGLASLQQWQLQFSGYSSS
jgi:5'-nucleotidase